MSHTCLSPVLLITHSIKNTFFINNTFLVAAAQPSAHPARSSTATFVTTAVVVDEWTEAPVARRTIDDGVARVQALDHQVSVSAKYRNKG